MEVEETLHDDSERQMPSLDDLAETAKQITETAKNFLAETQSLLELNQYFVLQQEGEGFEQIEITNETSSPHQSCWEIVVYDESVLIDSSKIPETIRRLVTFHTLSFRHLAKTEVQQSLWEEEKKILNREIERQKKEIKYMKENFDKMMEMTKKIMDCRPPPHVYVMCLKDQFLWFQLMRIARNLDPIIHTDKYFYDAYEIAPDWLKNSLCEFYIHGLIILSETEWNPLIFIGDVHL